jgi:hypothetical protein
MYSVMQRIRCSKFVTAFDGKSSLWTSLVKREHQWLSVLMQDSRLYEWSRVKVGMQNSGYSFVRAIKRILHPIRAFVESFVDAMAAFLDKRDKHLHDLDQYLHFIKPSGLTLNLNKFTFAKPEVKFCGHYMGSGMRRINPDKVVTVVNWQQPETKSQVRQILEFCDWFQDYLLNYAKHVLSSIELMSKRVPNLAPWGAQQHVFDTLKRLLCEAASQPLHMIGINRSVYSVMLAIIQWLQFCLKQMTMVARN